MFARKVLRPFAGLTYDDIMNEVRAIDKICKQITDHIVTVLRHGWLDSSFYYFDMELCEFNLEQYISGSNGGLMVFDDIMTWDILKQITLGLNYIHEQGLVHRDLKPRNGFVSLSNVHSDEQCSTLPVSRNGKLQILDYL